ncbi:MAG: FAD-dependent oxidoreductase [Planctomycetota bacterium]|nr:FAD-dependent oxidoreductase [Planctomycetota bacterium]
MDPSKPIAILGGGIAGLSLAHRLHARGRPFVLFEAAADLGGMSRTLRYGAFGVDTGAHRFHDKDPEITAWAGELLRGAWKQNHKRSAIVARRRFIDFPLSPLNVLANVPFTRGVRYVWDFLRRPKLEPDNFRDHALSRFGASLAEDFVLQYSRKLWGVPLERLSLELGTGRLKNLSLFVVLKEMFLGERRKNEHLDGSFYYPTGGYGKIVEALLRDLPAEALKPGQRVTKLERLARGFRVSTDRETLECPVVVGALPLTRLLEMNDWTEPELKSRAASLKHRHLVAVFVTLNKPEVSPHASLYIPDERFPVTRVHEPKQRCPTLAPADQTSLLAEVPLDDATAAKTATRAPALEKIRTDTVRQLSEAGLYEPGEVIESHVHIVPNAYPCITLDAIPVRRAAVEGLERQPGFYCLGRSARFEYTHLHQIFRESFTLAEKLAEGKPVAQAVR